MGLSGSIKTYAMDIFDKCHHFTRAREAVKEGWYPYFRPIESGPGTRVMVDGREMIMIGSNNYMGLTGHPKVVEASLEATKKYGTGCTGSRFLNGTLDIHLELEDKLARFVGKEAALCFSTGFQTNQGAISALVGKEDIVFVDRENHASIVDGYRLSFGKVVKYRHNDFEDLERVLKLHAGDDTGKMIISDGVFSMEGTIAPVSELARLAKKYDARLYIDDAHALGVLGEHGGGSIEHWNMPREIDLVMGTFSKSFASLGGFIAGDAVVIVGSHHPTPNWRMARVIQANASSLSAVGIRQVRPAYPLTCKSNNVGPAYRSVWTEEGWMRVIRAPWMWISWTPSPSSGTWAVMVGMGASFRSYSLRQGRRTLSAPRPSSINGPLWPIVYGGHALAPAANVFGCGADQTVIRVLLHDMGEPAARPSGREDSGEVFVRYSQGVLHRGGIKIHISKTTIPMPHKTNFLIIN